MVAIGGNGAYNETVHNDLDLLEQKGPKVGSERCGEGDKKSI